MHRLHATEARTGDRRSVIAVPASDDDVSPRLAFYSPIVTDESKDRVVCFRTRGIKENMRQAMSQFPRHFGSQPDRWSTRRLKKGVVVRQFGHLLEGHLGQLLSAVACIHAPKACHAI